MTHPSKNPLGASEPGGQGPLVSIIVPSFRMGRFLPSTLNSIFAQEYRPLDVVVVDGGSEDGTVEVLKRFSAQHPELRWVSEADDGPTDALNKGLAMAGGEIAGIQSADDVYYPGAVGAVVAAFERHPRAAIVYGDAEIIDADGRYLWGPTRYLPFTLERYLVGSTFLPQSSTFFRTELARAVGGLRSDYFVFDVDLWLRILFLARRRGLETAVKLDAVLSAYRRHEQQRDKETVQILESFRQMLADSTDIRTGPWTIRQAARAGGHMLTQHYNPTGSSRHQTAEIWRALLLYPPSVRALWKPMMLVPSRPTLRGILRRVVRRSAVPSSTE